MPEKHPPRPLPRGHIREKPMTRLTPGGLDAHTPRDTRHVNPATMKGIPKTVGQRPHKPRIARRLPSAQTMVQMADAHPPETRMPQDMQQKNGVRPTRDPGETGTPRVSPKKRMHIRRQPGIHRIQRIGRRSRAPATSLT